MGLTSTDKAHFTTRFQPQHCAKLIFILQWSSVPALSWDGAVIGILMDLRPVVTFPSVLLSSSACCRKCWRSLRMLNIYASSKYRRDPKFPSTHLIIVNWCGRPRLGFSAFTCRDSSWSRCDRIIHSLSIRGSVWDWRYFGYWVGHHYAHA